MFKFKFKTCARLGLLRNLVDVVGERNVNKQCCFFILSVLLRFFRRKWVEEYVRKVSFVV